MKKALNNSLPVRTKSSNRVWKPENVFCSCLYPFVKTSCQLQYNNATSYQNHIKQQLYVCLSQLP